MARPSSYTKAKADEIINRISAGESLTNICKDKHMPDVKTVYNWMHCDEHSPFFQAYLRARKIQADGKFDEISDICKELKEGKIDHNTARVLLDAKKFEASKLNPHVYGDKIQVDQDTSIKIEVVTFSGTDLPKKVDSQDPKLLNDDSEK